MPLKQTTAGTLEMALAMGLSGTLGFFVFESGQSNWNLVFFRCLFGALSLGVYLWYRGLLLPWPFTRVTLLLALVGGAALVANWLLLFSAYHYASISVATVIYHLQPFLLLLLGHFLLREKIVATRLPWFIIAFVGLILVSEINPSDFNTSPDLLIGALLSLGAAFLYAVATLVTKRLHTVKPQVLAYTQVLFGVFLLLPFVDFSATPSQTLQWGYLVILGLVHTGIMYILLYSAFQKLPLLLIAVLGFLYPATALLIDRVVYHQQLSLLQWAGIGLILVAALALNSGLGNSTATTGQIKRFSRIDSSSKKFAANRCASCP